MNLGVRPHYSEDRRDAQSLRRLKFNLKGHSMNEISEADYRNRRGLKLGEVQSTVDNLNSYG
jgi:hypothetical protein